jgi:hypothetical protein
VKDAMREQKTLDTMGNEEHAFLMRMSEKPTPESPPPLEGEGARIPPAPKWGAGGNG